MFKSVFGECQLNFIPANPVIKVPKNLKKVNNNFPIKMGLFYEILTSSLFGGKLVDSCLRQGGIKLGHPIPDVFSKSTSQMWESKALFNGNSLALLDSQVRLYKSYQLMYPDIKIYYAIWRHQFRGIKSFKGSINKLFFELSQKTIAGIVLPFSIVLHLFDLGFDDFKGSVNRYERDNWDHCTRVASSLINKFLLSPDKTLEFIDLSLKDYIWERFVLPDIKINTNSLKKFPFVVFHDRDHKRWVNKFLSVVPF